MVADADRNRAEDQRLREGVDARNELDTAAYQVQRQLDDLGEQAPSHERARAEMLINDAREAIDGQVPPQRARELTSELQQLYQSLGSRSAQAGAGAESPSGAPGASGTSAAGDEDVIDAEFDRS